MPITREQLLIPGARFRVVATPGRDDTHVGLTATLSKDDGSVLPYFHVEGCRGERCLYLDELDLIDPAPAQPAVAATGDGVKRYGFYGASRASLPERGAMWRSLRGDGVPVVSSWIYEDGEGETADFCELWSRICREVTGAEALILYAEPGDFPLKGALIEVGMALAAGVPVYAVLPGVDLEPRSMRPVGSWLAHPSVRIVPSVYGAVAKALAARAEAKP